jgi:hypothetical protein
VRPIAGLVAVVALVALVGAGCTPPGTQGATAESCALHQGAAPDPGPVVAVLADGSSVATTQAIEALTGDAAAAVWGAAVPGFPSGPAPEEAEAGIVLLATYDPAGTVRTVGEYDLRGVGSDSTRRETSARAAKDCLLLAANSLPVAPAPVVPSSSTTSAPAATVAVPPAAPLGGDLVRALGAARDLVQARAGGNPAAIVALGLGRSQVAGVPLSITDLRDETRPQVLAQIAASGVQVPDLSAGDTALLFLDPAEGIANSVSSAGITSFALDLCEVMAPPACGRTTTLGAPVETS